MDFRRSKILSKAAPHQMGGVSIGWVLAGSVVVIAVLFGLLMRKPPAAYAPAAGGPKQPLLIYCAAGLRKPVEQIAHDYERQYGGPVQLTYGGSQTLLASLEISQLGDLYIPADQSYVDNALAKGLAREKMNVAQMTPVLCVKKGNPLAIHSINDLFKDQVRLGQANPEAAAIGRLVKRALTQSGQWDEVARRTRVYKGTVNDVANDVKLGVMDVAFVWDALLPQYPELEGVSVPELSPSKGQIQITVLESTKQPTAALHFARYLTARDRGLPVFKQQGYQVVEGDAWAETPELHVLSGAMLRPAVEQTITDFEKREGARVTRVYNGCGILIAQMRAGERPDAYFSCERSFMTQVNDLFLDAEDISRNQLYILLPKGNPKGLKSLQDLGQENLKIGVGHEKQSALGAITKNLLLKSGYYDAVRKNVTVESPTGDFLVNQLRTGSLDAVIVYRSNANLVRDKLDSIPVDAPEAMAIQPVAVGRESAHKQLAQRLVESISSHTSKERFLSAGFEWVKGDQAMASAQEAAPRRPEPAVRKQ
jgi:molybdenum ABC transporter molybdate-binding protein